jgi:TolA-binding protein
MKKIGLMIVALSLSLSVAASASSIGAGGGQRPASRSRAEEPKGQRPSSNGKAVRGADAELSKTLANQIAQLKQEHQAAMNELEEIKRLAAEEKATKTLGAVERMIIRRNQEFQKRIEPLQKRLDAAGRPKPDQPKGMKAAPKEGSAK